MNAENLAFGLISLFFVGCLVGMVFLATMASELDEKTAKKYDGAVIAKICRNGSHIYQLKDGRYVAGSYEVSDIKTVCD